MSSEEKENSKLITKKPIVVTGANGFIASHVIEQLLQSGYKVIGTVRSLETSKVEHLTKMDKKGNLELVIVKDLTEDGIFDSIVKDVEYVFHIASPFAIDTKNPEKELVEPAVLGTTNFLKSCNKTDTIKKVVITSSIAAVTDSPEGNVLLSEKDWNLTSSLKRNPYYYSKKCAEESAWKFMKDNKPNFELITINPAFVFGPGHKKGVSESQQIFIDLLTGKYPFVMDLHWAIVDVRDVAKSHIIAMENSKANGRYICSGTSANLDEICKILIKKKF